MRIAGCRGGWFALVVSLGLLLSVHLLPAQAGDIVDTNSGIDFRVRLTATPGVVSITWQVSSATLNQGANDFEVQFFVGGGTQWQPQVSTDEPTDKGFPVLIGGVPDLFCFRMVATQNLRSSVAMI